MTKDILLAIGSNLTSTFGAPRENITAALLEVENAGAMIRKVSSTYKTPAFPPGSGPDYANAAALIDFDGTPEQLMQVLHGIESRFGRTRETRWGRRTLDIDLIGFGDVVLPDRQTHAYWRDLPLEDQKKQVPAQLVLPHPRVQDRAFVLVPLAEVAPKWIHPILHLDVTEMLSKLDQNAISDVQLIE